MIETTPQISPLPATAAKRDPELWAVSRALETSFLTEMLKSAGFGDARQSFGGGAGEEHFAGLLANEQAKALSDTGGIGLAESIYRSLVRSEN